MNKKSVGNAGESIACAYLKKIGYKILERNFRYEGGEIDIIALDKGVTVFVEVKYRSNLEFGYPADAVTQSKQRKIINGAKSYFVMRRIADFPMRFDVVEVIGSEVNHIIGAFEA